MSDKKVNIKVGAETKDAEKGINSITAAFNSMAKKIKNNLGTLSKLGNAINGLKSSYEIVSSAIGKVTDTLSECVDLYNVQADAETRLEVAAKNNPYLNSKSVAELKNYASELQNIGEIGDESLLPMMAELAAAGRTQEQIQQIMSAALDVSASGMISMDAAVQSLNNSLDGSVGSLGKLLPNLKNLTKEQLANGDAIKAVQKAYDGMSHATANSKVQLANSIGDLKEVIGSALNPITDTLAKAAKNFVDTIITGLTNIKKGIDEAVDALMHGSNPSGGSETSDLETQRKQLEEEVAYEESVYKHAKEEADKWREAVNKAATHTLPEGYRTDLEAQIDKTTGELKYFETYMNASGKIVRQVFMGEVSEEQQLFDKAYAGLIKLGNAEENETRTLKDLTNARNKLNAVNSKIAADEKAAAAETRASVLKPHTDEINKQTKALNEQIAMIRKKAEIEGVEVNKQDELNAYVSAYLKLYASEGSWAKTRLAEWQAVIKKYQAELGQSFDKSWYEMLNSGFDEAYKKVESSKSDAKTSKDFGGVVSSLKDLQKEADSMIIDIQKDIDGLWADGTLTKDEQAQYDYLIQIIESYKEKRKELAKEITATEKEEAAKQYEAINKVFSTISTASSNLYNSLNEFSELAQTQATNEATVKEAALEKEYSDGLISLEEYNDKKSKLDKEAAQKTYKLQMWAWSAQLLSIGASTAQSIVQTLSDSTISSTAVRIALAATVGALGSAQLATAIANKPIPPSSYATGGIVGGTSYSGDKVQANVNSGEMILNAQQQRQLWQMANGNGAGGLNVEVKNYMGDSANVSTSFDEGKLTIMVNKIVKSSMQNGEYTNALTAAQNLQNGTNYQS